MSQLSHTFGATLSAEQIRRHLSAPSALVRIEVVPSTGSTNSDLLSQVAGLSGPALLVAEQQTAGRGRAGRSWLSDPGNSLTFSLAWPFERPPHSLTGLPLAVGVALAEALIGMQVPVQLKWPNDLLKDGHKLAGILVETAQHGARTWAVIGVGLNLSVSASLESQIGHTVADAAWLARMDRNQVLATLLTHLVPALQTFAVTGLDQFLDRWNGLHAFTGRAVNLSEGGKVIRHGTALGIDQQGCLLLQDEQGTLSRVMVGDISLRAA